MMGTPGWAIHSTILRNPILETLAIHLWGHRPHLRACLIGDITTQSVRKDRRKLQVSDYRGSVCFQFQLATLQSPESCGTIPFQEVRESFRNLRFPDDETCENDEVWVYVLFASTGRDTMPATQEVPRK